MLPLDVEREFEAARDAEFFAALPSRPGVILLEMASADARPYLARTADIRRAAERLLRPPDTPSKRLNLRAAAARIRYRVTGSKFEQSLALYFIAREHFPSSYAGRLRLRAPALLKVNLQAEYPRCRVTRAVRAGRALYFGPFPYRRAAQNFAEAFLDLFRIRRCHIKIRRDPAFPGCIYSEMKMCLAPCFGGCTKQEYDTEVGLVLDALDTSGAALLARLEQEREAASTALDFERAGTIHNRLEKVSAVLRGLPEIARRIDRLDALILQRAPEEMAIAAFPIFGGLLAAPIFLRFSELQGQPRSAEAILREHLQAQTRPPDETKPEDSAASPIVIPAAPAALPKDWPSRYGLRSAPPELAEHLSLVARWFYSKPREGEIFFRDADWPYRRMLRACRRILDSGTAPPPVAVP